MTMVIEKELDAKEKQVGKTQGIHWSAGGQICFIDGFAWGIDTELNTICLGREEKVREAYFT